MAKWLKKHIDRALDQWTISDLMDEYNCSRFDRVDTSQADAAQRAVFARWHYHTDDELRLCVQASETDPPCFLFCDLFSRYSDTVWVKPGDLVVIPAGCVHAFEGSGEFIRLFTDSTEWTPIFAEG